MEPKLKAWIEGLVSRWPDGFTIVLVEMPPDSAREVERFVESLPGLPPHKAFCTAIRDSSKTTACVAGDMETSEIKAVIDAADRFRYPYQAQAHGEKARQCLRPLLARTGMKGIEISPPAERSPQAQKTEAQDPNNEREQEKRPRVQGRSSRLRLSIPPRMFQEIDHTPITNCFSNLSLGSLDCLDSSGAVTCFPVGPEAAPIVHAVKRDARPSDKEAVSALKRTRYANCFLTWRKTSAKKKACIIEPSTIAELEAAASSLGWAGEEDGWPGISAVLAEHTKGWLADPAYLPEMHRVARARYQVQPLLIGGSTDTLALIAITLDLTAEGEANPPWWKFWQKKRPGFRYLDINQF